MACAAELMSPSEDPKILIATSPRVPVSISETRISIGCVNPYTIPGNPSRTTLNLLIMSSLFPDQSSFGFKTRNISVSFRPIGSSPNSSAPARATIDFTSFTDSKIDCSTRVSCVKEFSREIDGSFCN